MDHEVTNPPANVSDRERVMLEPPYACLEEHE